MRGHESHWFSVPFFPPRKNSILGWQLLNIRICEQSLASKHEFKLGKQYSGKGFYLFFYIYVHLFWGTLAMLKVYS